MKLNQIANNQGAHKRKDKDIAEIAAEVADDARQIAAGAKNG